MKTGFDLAGNDTYEDKKNIVALVTLFGENAIRTSFTYVKHAKRNGITIEDLRRCIMLETFFFMKRPDVLEKAEEIKEMLYGEEEDDEEEEIVTVEKEEAFSENNCSCALCKCMNSIYDRWEGWTPSSLFETVIKKHISWISLKFY